MTSTSAHVVCLILFDFSIFLSLLSIFSLSSCLSSWPSTTSSTMWWSNSLCTSANEDLGTLAEYDPLTFNGPAIPFGAIVEYHPISAKDISRLHQFGSKSCQVYSSVMHFSRCESGKETLWSQTLKNWKRWTHLNSTRKRLNAKDVRR